MHYDWSRPQPKQLESALAEIENDTLCEAEISRLTLTISPADEFTQWNNPQKNAFSALNRVRNPVATEPERLYNELDVFT